MSAEAVAFMHELAGGDVDAANISADGEDVVVAHVASDDLDAAEDVAESFGFLRAEADTSDLDGRQQVTYRRAAVVGGVA